MESRQFAFSRDRLRNETWNFEFYSNFSRDRIEIWNRKKLQKLEDALRETGDTWDTGDTEENGDTEDTRLTRLTVLKHEIKPKMGEISNS